jgi:hypothetical protein
MRVSAALVLDRLMKHITITKSQRVRIRGIGNRSQGQLKLDWVGRKRGGQANGSKGSNRIRATATSRFSTQHKRVGHKVRVTTCFTTRLLCQNICMMKLLAWPFVWGHRGNEAECDSWDSDAAS